MKLDLTGLRIEVTDAIREFTERKIKKLDKFFEYKSHTYLAREKAEDLY